MRVSALHFRLLLDIVILFTLINASNTIDGVDLLCCLYFIVNFLALSLLFYKFKAASELQLCAIMVILMVTLPLQCIQGVHFFG